MHLKIKKKKKTRKRPTTKSKYINNPRRRDSILIDQGLVKILRQGNNNHCCIFLKRLIFIYTGNARKYALLLLLPS